MSENLKILSSFMQSSLTRPSNCIPSHCLAVIPAVSRHQTIYSSNSIVLILYFMMTLCLFGCSIRQPPTHQCESKPIISNLNLIEELQSKVPKPRIWFFHENNLVNASNPIPTGDWGRIWHQQLLVSGIFQNLENVSEVSAIRHSLKFDEIDTRLLQNANLLILVRTEMISATEMRGELKMIELGSNMTLYYGVSILTKNRQEESAIDIITPRFFRIKPERNLMFNFAERVKDLAVCSIKTMGEEF